MMKICISIVVLSVCSLCRAEEVTVDLSQVELPAQAQKALDKYAEEKVEAEQAYRKQMEKLKAAAIRDLQRQLKRADGLEQLALQERIKSINEEVAVDLFGTPIAEPAPPMPVVLEKILNGQHFRHTGSNMSFFIVDRKEASAGSMKGDIEVSTDSFKIAWENGNTVEVKLREDGVPTLTRSAKFGGQTFEISLLE